MLPWKRQKRHILPVSQNLSSVYFSLAKFQLVSCNLFTCHDLANDIYSQTAKTVFSHLKDKLPKADKCLYVIRSLRKEGYYSAWGRLFIKTIVLPNVTYALVVHGASEPEIATVQDFLNRCHKRQYISVRLNVRASLEKQDRKAF